MIARVYFVLAILISPFKSQSRLEAENAALRQQLIILRRKVKARVKLTNSNRWFFVQLCRWFPSILEVVTIIRPETLLRWHRAGFRRYWDWKSRRRGGRPQVEAELRALIRQMSIENPLWGAPRIHGELLKLGFAVSQSSVAKYMVERREPPSQGWRTFLRNHLPAIAAMDLFVVPTISFDLLYAFVIVMLDRRTLLWMGVTRHPTAEWIARQITEAFPWNEAPRYLIRDRDRIFGARSAPGRERLDGHSYGCPLVLRGITEASQPQLPRPGPSGQPIESSQLGIARCLPRLGDVHDSSAIGRSRRCRRFQCVCSLGVSGGAEEIT
jgi:hypothetical protein